jgi:H+/Cl- antiporter ClcA
VPTPRYESLAETRIVPEIKAVSPAHPSAMSQLLSLYQILGGYVLDSFLSPWTLLIKALGLALAVASGLSLGKEV